MDSLRPPAPPQSVLGTRSNDEHTAEESSYLQSINFLPVHRAIVPHCCRCVYVRTSHMHLSLCRSLCSLQLPHFNKIILLYGFSTRPKLGKNDKSFFFLCSSHSLVLWNRKMRETKFVFCVHHPDAGRRQLCFCFASTKKSVLFYFALYFMNTKYTFVCGSSQCCSF